MTLETVEKIKSYIQEHIGEKITNIGLAKEFSYCVQSIADSFRQHEGISLHQYVIKAKMHKAKEYLEEGYYARELPEMLGYRSRYIFAQAYEKEFGESPKKTEMRLCK